MTNPNPKEAAIKLLHSFSFVNLIAELSRMGATDQQIDNALVIMRRDMEATLHSIYTGITQAQALKSFDVV
jgi:hypothetical protein